jgi:hypothetical protein
MFKAVGYNRNLDIINQMEVPEFRDAEKLAFLMRKADDRITRVTVYDTNAGVKDPDYKMCSTVGDELQADRRLRLRMQLDCLTETLDRLAVDFYRNKDREAGDLLNHTQWNLLKLAAELKEKDGETLTENDEYWLNQKQTQVA